MTVLTENDWKTVQNALQRMDQVTIERTYQPKRCTVIVSTRPADKPWTVAMIVEVWASFRGGWWRKYCESVKEAKELIKEWDGWAK